MQVWDRSFEKKESATGGTLLIGSYRKVFEMKKQRSVEVVKRINERANGGSDANEMT